MTVIFPSILPTGFACFDWVCADWLRNANVAIKQKKNGEEDRFNLIDEFLNVPSIQIAIGTNIHLPSSRYKNEEQEEEHC